MHIPSLARFVKRAAKRQKACRMIAHGAIPAYWWAKTINFGDLITPYLIEKLTDRKAVNIRGLNIHTKQTLCSTGSILQDLEEGDFIVWGSGFITPVTSSNRTPTINALRGPLSGEIASSIGWRHPAKYGDPGLLLPFLLPGGEITEKAAVVPNYSLIDSTKIAYDGAYLVNPMRSVSVVVPEISRARMVLSSSLHGLIVAQAYGRPWVWLRDRSNSLYGGDFKFHDFFASIGLSNAPSMHVSGPITQEVVESAERIAGLADPSELRARQRDLIISAPHFLELSKALQCGAHTP